mgnify:CR=1 FL=1
MKLTLKQYTEPLTIEVERPDGTTDFVELVLNLSDTNAMRSEKAARKIVETSNAMEGEDVEKQARELSKLVANAIDIVAGEGAADKIVAAFGVDGAADCLSGLADVWKAINDEAMHRVAEKRVAAAERYLDAEA